MYGIVQPMDRQMDEVGHEYVLMRLKKAFHLSNAQGRCFVMKWFTSMGMMIQYICVCKMYAYSKRVEANKLVQQK